jgi:hypothetical protein
MPVQEWIHHWGEGAGLKAVRIMAAILGFIALAAIYDRFTIYDLLSSENYSSEEAMETAQVARNLSEGKGYTTDSIRPLTLHLLETAAEPGQSSKILAQPIPDLTTPPLFPAVLGGLMKVLPFQFEAKEYWAYQPDHWISIFNQVLLFAATLLVFFLARALFEPKVAWLSAVLFAGTDLFWRFSISGLSTVLVIVIFLCLCWCLVVMERKGREATEGTGLSLIPLAAVAGALVASGGLTRYAFAWMIVPVLLFVALGVPRGRIKLSLTVALVFVALMTPWLGRNLKASGHLFGTAGYALFEGTALFPDDTLERSIEVEGRLHRVTPGDLASKFLADARDSFTNDLPKIGGSWIAAFFIAGLLIPFRNAGLAKLRWFLLGSLLLLFLVQAMGRTHLSTDVPQINSENLLVILAPPLFIYGAAMFNVLLEQLQLPPFGVESAAVWAFAGVMCAPFLLTLLAPRAATSPSPYSPLHIAQTGRMMKTNEALMSDIPSGVAWYGRRSCVWLSLDDENEFFKVNGFKPVQGLFLTQRTTDKPFLSQLKGNPRGWGHFILECAEHSEIPVGFPLRKSPVGLLPEQLFLSDRDRWQELKVKP